MRSSRIDLVPCRATRTVISRSSFHFGTSDLIARTVVCIAAERKKHAQPTVMPDECLPESVAPPKAKATVVAVEVCVNQC